MKVSIQGTLIETENIYTIGPVLSGERYNREFDKWYECWFVVTLIGNQSIEFGKKYRFEHELQTTESQVRELRQRLVDIYSDHGPKILMLELNEVSPIKVIDKQDLYTKRQLRYAFQAGRHFSNNYHFDDLLKDKTLGAESK